MPARSSRFPSSSAEMSARLWWGMLCSGLMGCASSSTATDRARYSAVLSNPSPPEDALQRCAEIGDVVLAGDCALVVVAQVAEPGPLCGSVPEGMWREECWFIAAEASNRSGDALSAAGLCQKSGRFALDCAQHLWQTPVHGLIHGPGAEGFAVVLPSAEVLYAAWAPLLVEQTDFEERFWSKFFGNGFEGQSGPIDLGWCSSLSTERQGACLDAGIAHYAREIGPSVERAGGSPLRTLPRSRAGSTRPRIRDWMLRLPGVWWRSARPTLTVSAGDRRRRPQAVPSTILRSPGRSDRARSPSGPEPSSPGRAAPPGAAAARPRR